MQASKSLHFAHKAAAVKHLVNELTCRRKAGFNVRYLEKNELQQTYGLESEGAILSEIGGKVDTFRFTVDLHAWNVSKGARVYEHAGICEVTFHKNGVGVRTENGARIAAKKIVFATGYEAVESIQADRVALRSTFALASEKVQNLPGAFRETIAWNTGDPYLYFREDEGRLILGGRDLRHENVHRREKLLGSKTEKLVADFNAFVPGIQVKPAFAWAGTFGSTNDGLPYIGQSKNSPQCYYALGYGGNGIIFSTIAARYISRSIKSGENKVPEFFGFER